MLSKSLLSFLLLPAALRIAFAQNTTTSSGACNNSPSLCSQPYDRITHLGAHDSPFLRDESTDFSTSGNQFYNSSTQLSAGVRLLSAQVQRNDGGDLHVCHTSCDLLDAGPLSGWLREVRLWLESNQNEVVTILLVNGDGASASELAMQYDQAGIPPSLTYVPTGSTAADQTWPTLQSLINSGTRLLNFVDYISDTSASPYLMEEFNYIFENNYDVTSSTGFSCEANRPTNVANNTRAALSSGMMPLMNHILYQDMGFGIQAPNQNAIENTNSPNSGVGTLSSAATECTNSYGRAPTFVLVDFFNVGPAIAVVDRLNGVTSPVGRNQVSTAILESAANIGRSRDWSLFCACLALLLGLMLL